MRIAILAIDGMFDSGLSVVLDILAAANMLDEEAASAAPFEVTVVSTGRMVRTGHGLALATVPLAELTATPDLLVMPAVGLKAPAEVVDAVRGHRLLAEVVALRREGAALAAACSGTFFLAEAGVLDGLAATTSWWLGPTFRRRYPQVRLDGSRTLVRDDQVTTAGAAFAHIDLALSIVQQRSPALADLITRHLVVGERPSQAVVAVPTVLAGNHPTVAAFERWVRDHLDEPLQVGQVAASIGVSERTLQRTTSTVLGMSPIDFIHDIRLDHATFLLRTTGQTIDAVTAAVGYRNTSTLRALVRRRRGTTVGALRAEQPGLHPAPG